MDQLRKAGLRFWRSRREVLLLTASVALSLLAAEIVLRLHYLMSYSGTLEDLHEEPRRPPPGTAVKLGDMLAISSSPRLIYQLIPDLDVEFHGTSVRTNSVGWREGEIAHAKGADTIRIVGLGDSYMFGWRVEERERYLDLLGESLNRDYPARRWETVALAVPGYNLVMEVEALKRFGLAYSPDLILYDFRYNDFCLPNFVSNRRRVWSLESFLGFYLRRGFGAAGPRLVGRLEVLRRRSEGIDRPGDRDSEEFYAAYCSEDNVPREHRGQVGGESFLRALRELVDVGRQRRIPVVFLHHGFADLDRVSATTTSWVGEALAEVGRLDGLVTVDLAADIRRQVLEAGVDRSEMMISESDRHLSPRGHRLVAAKLQDQLAARGVVDRLLAAASATADGSSGR